MTPGEAQLQRDILAELRAIHELLPPIERARAEAVAKVRAYLKQPSVRKRAVAEAARLHPNTLQGVEADDWNPTDTTLIALERHMSRAGLERAS